MRLATPSKDLTAYLLGERSELRPLLEAISEARSDDARQRAAVEYLVLLASARQAASGQPPEAKALAQVRAQYSAMFSLDVSEHATLVREVHIALASGLPIAVVTALKLLGLYHRKQGSYQLARASFGVAAELANGTGDPLERLNTLFWLGVIERYVGNLNRAEETHQEQLGLAREVGNRAQAVLAQENLGLVALRRGQIGEARGRVMRALTEALQLDDSELQGYCYHALMVVEVEAGRPGEAAVCGWEAYRRYESSDQQLRAMQDCAVLMFNCGRYESAEAAWDIIRTTTADVGLRIRCQIGLTDVAARLDKRTVFETMSESLLAEGKLRDLALERVEALHTIGLGYSRFGEVAEGRQYLMRSLALARENGYAAQAEQIGRELAGLGAAAVESEVAGLSQADAAQLESVGQHIKTERARLCA